PSGRTAPKGTGDGLNKYRGVEGESLALACAAQGFPAPISSANWKPRWRNPHEIGDGSATLRKGCGPSSPSVTSVLIRVGPRGCHPINGANNVALHLYTSNKSHDIWLGSSRRQPVQLNERVRQVSGTLIIREARVEDSGKYLCIVNNSVGGESVETVLTVTAPLAAEIEPSTQTIDFGRPATFTCNVRGNPIKTVSWLKDGKPLGLEEPVLRIESVKKEDKGMYQCFVRNDQESAQATAELKLGGRFEPPQIRQAFAEETLQPGPSMFLKCVASGNPTPEITWELDGKRLSNTERLQVGQYVTVNGDVVGSAEHSARLNVYGLPFIRHMDKKAIVAGETLRVTCPVAGYPIESIVWERDTRVLPINRKQKVFPNGTLIIENVERMSDQATYTCVARNAQGYSARGTLEVQVMVPPTIQQFSFTKLPMNAGEFANLQCIVPTGDLPLNIRWSYPGEEMGGSSGVLAKKVADRVSMLMISVITARHAGEYVCTAENAAGTASHSTTLTVNGSGLSSSVFLERYIIHFLLLPIAFNAEVANSGDSVSVPCSILKGDMPMDISWAFNGVPIDTSKDASITVTRISKHLSTLSIDGVSARHAGEYACSASNLAGSVSRSATLTVNGTISLFNLRPSTLYVPSAFCAFAVNKTPRSSLALPKRSKFPPLMEHLFPPSIVLAPQILPFAFGDEPASWGELVSVTCSVAKGDQPLEISWAFNGTPIDSHHGSDVVIGSTNKKNSVLTIESVAARHAGEYTCSASNRAGATTHSSRLTVNGTCVRPVRILQFSFGDDPLNSGEMLSVSCTIVKGDFPVNLTWTFDDTPIDSSRPDVNIIINKRVSFLSIDSVAARHAGRYKCIASNAAGSDSHTAVLSVNVGPQLAPFVFGDEAANAGEMATVQCAVIKGDLPVKIVWSLNGRPVDVGRVSGDHSYDIPDIDIVVTRSSKRISTLTIDSVAARHAGEYSCTATNAAGSATHTSVLSVNVCNSRFGWLVGRVIHAGVCETPRAEHCGGGEHSVRDFYLAFSSSSEHRYPSQRCCHVSTVPPRIAPFEMADRAVNWGDSVSAVCTVVNGDSPLEISWALNNMPVDESHRISVTTTKRNSLLSIDSASPSHAGTYTCVASNAAGATSYSAELTVNDTDPKHRDTETRHTFIFIPSSSFRSSLLVHCNPVIRIIRIAPTRTFVSSYVCIGPQISMAENTMSVTVAPQIAPFVITEEPANWGESISVVCAILKGDLPIEITWALNGEPISRDRSDVNVLATTRKNSILSIESVAARHAGEYTCSASNKAGATSHSATLAVNGTFPLRQRRSPMYLFLLLCLLSYTAKSKSVSAVEAFAISFQQKNAIDPSDSRDLLEGRIERRWLRIIGNRASTIGQSRILCSSPLFVVAPEIAPFVISEKPANWGDTVTATCTMLKGDSPIQIEWALNGEPISHDYSDISIATSRRVSLLTIDAVTASHAGEYTCMASNAAGGTSFTATLAVNGTMRVPCSQNSQSASVLSMHARYTWPGSFPFSHDSCFDHLAPEIVPFVIGEGPANWGDTVTATCTVLKGDHPIQIEWALNGEPISRNHYDISIVNTSKRVSVLTIDAVTARHAGEYTCSVSNAAGGTSYSASLAVNGTKRCPRVIFSFLHPPLLSLFSFIFSFHACTRRSHHYVLLHDPLRFLCEVKSEEKRRSVASCVSRVHSTRFVYRMNSSSVFQRKDYPLVFHLSFFFLSTIRSLWREVFSRRQELTELTAINQHGAMCTMNC
ncbi:unnamed protein product, partial [Heterotrigona itama]